MEGGKINSNIEKKIYQEFFIIRNANKIKIKLELCSPCLGIHITLIANFAIDSAT